MAKERAASSASEKHHQQQNTDLIASGGLLTSWLAAHVVQAAAGTDTAADEDEQNDNEATNTKDHGQWRGIELKVISTKEETKKKIIQNNIYVAITLLVQNSRQKS